MIEWCERIAENSLRRGFVQSQSSPGDVDLGGRLPPLKFGLSLPVLSILLSAQALLLLSIREHCSAWKDEEPISSISGQA